VLAVGLLLPVLLAASCDGSGPHTYTIRVSAGAALLEPGDHLRIDLGGNDAGTGWFLTQNPDDTILTPNGEDFNQGEHFWNFTAVGPGFQTLAFQECRDGTAPPTCSSDQIPTTVAVRVRNR
jgi:hypothetical protein